MQSIHVSFQCASAGGDDNIMLSGQSRVDTFSQHQMEAAGMSDSAGSSSTSSFNSYDNHNMAASSSPTDQYYRSVGMRRSSAPSSSSNSNNNYRLSHQSRNFYPAIDDDVPEPLPMPMASASDCNSSSGVNCTVTSAHQVNKTQTAPLVSS